MSKGNDCENTTSGFIIRRSVIRSILSCPKIDPDEVKATSRAWTQAPGGGRREGDRETPLPSHHRQRLLLQP
jgi:hypothetical protein